MTTTTVVMKKDSSSCWCREDVTMASSTCTMNPLNLHEHMSQLKGIKTCNNLCRILYKINEKSCFDNIFCSNFFCRLVSPATLWFRFKALNASLAHRRHFIMHRNRGNSRQVPGHENENYEHVSAGDCSKVSAREWQNASRKEQKSFQGDN